MVNYHKIKNLKDKVAINKEKLQSETDVKKKEKLRCLIQIDILKIKIERLH
jgi:hypothetical protein